MNLRYFGAWVLGLSVMSTVANAETAKVVIAPTVSTVAVAGTLTLQDTPMGLKIMADIQKAPPGKHAFHIHEFGDCGDMAKAAGSHYNPAGHPHGNTLKDGVEKAHAGDFGSLIVGADGKGSLQAVIPGLTLSGGQYNAAGRAFILHEKEDDFSQPTGNAGGRIGCGPILLTAQSPTTKP